MRYTNPSQQNQFIYFKLSDMRSRLKLKEGQEFLPFKSHINLKVDQFEEDIPYFVPVDKHHNLHEFNQKLVGKLRGFMKLTGNDHEIKVINGLFD